jgi:hypothetical protein
VTAIPDEVLGLRVEVVRSVRRTAGLHIVGTDLQVRVPEDLGDERVAEILKQKRPSGLPKSVNQGSEAASLTPPSASIPLMS